jgi:hypothetical protein
VAAIEVGAGLRAATLVAASVAAGVAAPRLVVMEHRVPFLLVPRYVCAPSRYIALARAVKGFEERLVVAPSTVRRLADLVEKVAAGLNANTQ